MKKINAGSISLIIALVISFFSTEILDLIPNISEFLPENIYLRIALLRLWDYSPIFIVGLIFFRKDIIALLGVNHFIPKALLIALIICLPQILTFLIFYDVNSNVEFSDVFQYAITPSIFEEVAYRAFVFGALFYIYKWGFYPAVLINAVIFGLAHLYQAQDPLNALFIFLITFIGSIWFSWLYMKWDKNLFLIIFLHLVMNLAYEVFDGDSGAAGNLYANIGRFATVIFSIIVTLKYTGSKKFGLSNFKI